MDRRHRPLFPDRLIAVAVGAVLVASCGSDAAEETQEAPVETTVSTAASVEASDPPSRIEPGDPSTFFPDVLAAEAIRADDGTWTFAVTLSSPYDTPEHYADAWRVVDPDGTEYGSLVLLHDHANEQPFTRSQAGIEIPEGVTTVRIEGRDQLNGWGGTFLNFELPS